MLKQLRSNKAKRWMLLVLILIIPSFVAFYGWSSITRDRQMQMIEFARFSPPGAYHYGIKGWRIFYPVTDTEMTIAQRQVADRLRGIYGADTVEQWVRQYGLDSLVPWDVTLAQAMNDWVLRDHAADQGIRVSDAELRDRVQNMLRGVPPQYWRAALRDAGYDSEDAFIASQREQARLEKSEFAFMDQAPVSLYRAWDDYRLENEKVALDTVSFALLDYRSKVEVSDPALRDYYKAHEEDFRVGDQRRYEFAYLKKDSLAGDVSVTSSAVQAYYEAHTDKYQVGDRLKVRQIVLDVDASASDEDTTKTYQAAAAARARIDGGEDFAKVADAVSQDKGNMTADGKKRGGAVDKWISQKDLREYGYPYLQAALGAAPGEVVGPVRTTGEGVSGWVIVKVEDKKPAGIEPFDAVKAQVEKDALAEELDKAFQDRTQAISEKVASYSTLDTMAKDLKMADGLSSWVLTDSPFISSDLEFMQKANLDFLKTLQVGEVSGLLQGRDMAYVLRVLEEKPAHIPAFEEIREKVEGAYREAKGREAMERDARAFLAKLGKDDSLTTSAKQAGLTALRTSLFKRSDIENVGTMPTGMQAPLVDFAKSAYGVSVGQTGISAAGFSKDMPLAYVVWQVREVQTPDRAAFDKEGGVQVARQVFGSHQRLLNEWLWDQRAAMKVEKNKDRMR